ncbi:phosphotransferase family protein [Deinococcus planocerae]|uniref:phosphotransferase family protein n=1 Tax=Deinococcus planocerae TaxID=1737569 RepID=UPI0015E0AF3B|nr:phosphotransferase [Deinococcus planocerae]
MVSGEWGEGASAVRVATQSLGYTVRDVERLPGASGNPSWRVEAAEGTFAARLYPRSEAGTAHGLARLAEALRAGGYPVPRVVAVGETGEHAVLVQAWAPGVPLRAALEQVPEHAHDLGLAFGETHARLHALPVPAEAHAALRVLGGPTGVPASPSWLHLDYHPFNVLVEGGQVSAVLDWENVALGDARLDVARTLSILSADPSVWPLSGTRRRALLLFRRGYLAGYARGGGRLENMAPFLAWAGEFMRRDLRGRFADGELWHVARWTRAWKART